MLDSCSIWLPDAEFTRKAGVSLASTLYRQNVTIGFNGELGAGKTTFIQGFLKGLGISDSITSPTYALEQRYESDLGEVIHIDLYRLEAGKDNEFLHSIDDHLGVRCIEWIERSTLKPDILVTLTEKDEGRELTVEFNDMPLPTEEDIVAWRKEVALPDRICQHCDAVRTHALDLAKQLQDRGVILRPQALTIAALIHDLLRFIDFVPGGGHGPDESTEAPEWEVFKKKYEGKEHEAACAALLRERGYSELASIVEVHGLMTPAPDRPTIEQRLLFYTDKCVKMDEVVTLEERFEDFRVRYTDGKHTKEGDIWYAQSLQIEKDLGFTA